MSLSDSWESMSWLDHAVASSDMHSVIYRMEIGYGIVQEDDMPVVMDLCVSELPSLVKEADIKADKLDWENMEGQELADYTEMTELLLSAVKLLSAVHCTYKKCKLAVHMDEIHDIIGCLCEGGKAKCVG